jgi:hypothetical protein
MSVSQELLSAIEAWKVEDEKFTDQVIMLLVLVPVRHYKRSVNWLRPVEVRLPKRRMPVRKQRIDSRGSTPYTTIIGNGGPNFE